MGCFSNGTEGELYWERYCARCVHREGCAVWFAHEILNYKECNNENSALHILIPREGIENKQCKMFLETSKVYRGTLPEHLKEWAEKRGIVEAKY